MNKKYLLMFGGVILLIIVFTAILLFQQNTTFTPTTNNTASQHSNTAYSSQGTVGKSVTPSQQPEDAAQQATRQFYTYYFSYSSNPLANGAFQNNQYLSPDFKQVIAGLYDNGNSPVFCPENKSASIVVGQEQQVPYNNTYLLQEVISQAPPGKKDLYRVMLKNVNGKWLIYDINCI